MPCNVEFGHELSICSRTEENHGKPYSIYPDAELSGCKPTSSKPSGIVYTHSDIIPYLAVVLFDWLLNCCLPWPAEWFLVPSPTGRMTIFHWRLWELSDSLPLYLNFIYTTRIHANSVRTSQETHYVSARKPNRLMLFRAVTAVYSGNHVKHIIKLCAQNAEFLNTGRYIKLPL
jgi:hypothetical protein